ncbi:MAG: TrpB-like pyridoxal-phosphate dependent enzyme, partial [Pseudomonadota bacterium]|nr:TrpB-like pyridoxal-phosphate dependent enzyme [Pseudomonadota bacterium]
ENLIEAVAVPQLATFEAGVLFARAEGIIPAPESNHAIRAAIDEALRCKETGEPQVIFFNLSGHGHFDMAAYDRYFAGELTDYEYPEAQIAAALERLPKVAAAGE